MAAQENLFKCLSMPECIQGMKEGLQPGSLANQTLVILKVRKVSEFESGCRSRGCVRSLLSVLLLG
eukprot:scaffold160897_cov17-Tisochrysis_lutea.AAC.1